MTERSSVPACFRQACGDCRVGGAGSRRGLPGPTALLAALLSIASGLPARAETYWTNTGGDNLWNSAANWNAGIPNSETAVAVLQSQADAPNSALIVDLGGNDFQIHALDIRDGYTVETALAPSTLTLSGSGAYGGIFGNGAYIVTADSGTGAASTLGSSIAIVSTAQDLYIVSRENLTIASDVTASTVASPARVVFLAGAGTTTTQDGVISDGDIAGAAREVSVVVGGTPAINGGEVMFTAAQRYTGTTVVSLDSSLTLQGNGTLASDRIRVENGATLTTDGGGLAATATVMLSDTARFAVTGDETIAALTGTDTGVSTTLAAGATLAFGDGAGGASPFAGSLGGDGRVAYLNATGAPFTLSGPVSLAGGFDISAGRVAISGDATGTDFTLVDGGVLSVDSGGSSGTVTIGRPQDAMGGGALELHGGTVTEVTAHSANSHVANVDGTISGTTTALGGATIAAQGGAFGAVLVGQGSFVITRDTDVAGDFTNAGTIRSSGGAPVTLTIAEGHSVTNTGTLDGDSIGTLADLTIRADTIVLGGGSVVAGRVFLDGAITSNGTTTIAAASTLEAATLNNTGTLNLGPGATLRGTGNTFNNNGITTLAEGATLTDAGAINNATTGTIRLLGSATLNADDDDSGGGAIVNAGTVHSDAGGSDTITLGDDDGDMDLFTNTGTLIVGSRDTFAGAETEMTSSGTITIGDGGALNLAMLDSRGTLALNDGAALRADLVTNRGRIAVSGSATISASVAGDGGAATASVLTLANGAASDRLSIDGDLVASDVTALDVDLSRATGGLGDTIVVTGNVSGSTVFSFNVLGADLADLSTSLDLLRYGGTSTLRYTSSGLPGNGAVLYSLVQDSAARAIQLQSSANPAIGGLVSGLTLTQSLLGSVVNRPSSAFVTGRAADSGQGCGSGSWGRAIGGRASATGRTATALGSSESDLDASYRGLQAGFDSSCLGSFSAAGWTLTFGGMLGVNTGNTTQPVHAFDTTTGNIDPALTSSINTQDFEQIYGGVYLSTSHNQMFADLQLRYENTSFDLQNIVPVGGAALGVADQSYRTRGFTFSGSLGNSFTLNRNRGLSLVPSIGFSVSNLSVDDLTFDNGTASTADDGVLRTDAIKSRIGFASLALTKLSLLPGGTSAVRYFGTATIYSDFGADTTSRYYQKTDGAGSPDPSVAPLISESATLGTYAELSLGLNYTRVMDGGGALAARQLDASLRADSRFSDDLEGWGLTAQIRISF